MRTPTRKPGKYTHLKQDPNITQFKYEELKNRLEKLIKHKRPQVAKEVKFYAQNGDFSENAEYQNAKGRLRGINQRILDIEDLLKRSVIIKPNKGQNIQLGNIVTIESDNKTKTYQILGSAETNPATGVISHNSPLGSALLNRKPGDTVTITINSKEKTYKIIKVQ